MKTLTFKSTLFYYDGPQVIEAKDPIGGHYVGVLVETEEGKDRFLIAGVNSKRLRRFKVGSLDLRALFVYLDDEQWFLGDVDAGGRIELEAQTGDLAETDFLPGEGFFLHATPSVTDVALVEARTRNNLCFEVAIEPREAHEQHKVRSKTLVGLLTHWQAVVKHAYGKAFGSTHRGKRPEPDQYAFDVVVPAAAGSFRIVMEAAIEPDFFATGDLYRAFELIDYLFSTIDDPEKTAAAITEFRGHLAGSVLRLLRFLSENDTGLRYSWALPDFPAPARRAISRVETGPLLQILERNRNLTIEETEIVGILDKGSQDGKTWTLIGEKEIYTGTARRGGAALHGLTFGERYVFTVREEIQWVEISGREKINRFLLSHRPA